MKKILFCTLVLLGIGTFSFGQSLGHSSMTADQPAVTQSGQTGNPEEVANELGDGVSVFIPNAFTPNQDGVNDVFYIPTSTGFSEFEFSVFDRWGNQVFTALDPNFKWDGRINSKDIPEGIYVFVLKGLTADGRNIKRSGTISVMR